MTKTPVVLGTATLGKPEALPDGACASLGESAFSFESSNRHKMQKFVDMALRQVKVCVEDYHCAGGSLPLPVLLWQKIH